MFAKNVVDYAIFAAPPPVFHNFRYLNFYDRKDLIAKKNKGFCYHLSSENSKSVHEETKNLSPGSSLYKWRLIKKTMTWEHRWYLYCSNLNNFGKETLHKLILSSSSGSKKIFLVSRLWVSQSHNYYSCYE